MTFPAEIDSLKLQSAIKKIFIEKDTILPIRTRAVVVLYKGQLIAEHYADGFSSKTRLAGWSMTKTVTDALTGILVKQGKLNIEYTCTGTGVARLPHDPRHAITIENLLQQRSGLDFEEIYSRSSDATRMLFQKADMGGFTASHPLKIQPGSEFLLFKWKQQYFITHHQADRRRLPVL